VLTVVQVKSENAMTLGALAADLLITAAGAFSTEAGKAAFARFQAAVISWIGGDVDPTDEESRDAVQTRVDALPPAVQAELEALRKAVIDAGKADPAAAVTIDLIETRQANFENIVAGEGKAVGVKKIVSDTFTIKDVFGSPPHEQKKN
jgi:hypothetical protein